MGRCTLGGGGADEIDGYCPALTVPERRAQDDFADQSAAAIIILLQRFGQFLNGATVAILQAAS